MTVENGPAQPVFELPPSPIEVATENSEITSSVGSAAATKYEVRLIGCSYPNEYGG